MKAVSAAIVSALVALIVSTGAAGEDRGARDAVRPAAADAGTVPEAPPTLQLKIAQGGFLLYWKLSPQDPGKVTGYEIVRSDRFSGPFDPVARVEKGTTRYIDATAARETIYFYKVRALAGTLSSPFSNIVTGER